MNNKISLSSLYTYRSNNKKISVVSCYDYLTARACQEADIEMLIVGDSAAQLMLGYPSTNHASMDFMLEITAACHRGAPNCCIVADMPFLSYTNPTEAIKNAGLFLLKANADIIKFECNESQLGIIKEVSDAGIPVMAHLGILPQTGAMPGAFKAKATTANESLQLIKLAEATVYAGAKSILLEGTTTETAEIITKNSPVPVISCGSGPHCDGQVLIWPDISGITQNKLPKFAKRFANLNESITKTLLEYKKQVSDVSFPDQDHSYHMKPGENEKLIKMLQDFKN